MVENPQVSIYGTVYNSSSYIKNSIDSIIDQFKDFRDNFEMVIVDNYSTDGTYEILKEYQKEYNNIEIIQEKCTRGKGRQIAFNNTKGNFVFTVDFDTVYSESLSKIVYYALKNYEENSLFSQSEFCSRATMEKIGNWIDSNEGEGIELIARAISKGIKVYFVPALYSKNAISSKRETRYAKGIFKYAVRGFKYYRDRIISEGITSREGLITNTMQGKILINLAFVYLKLANKKVYNYSSHLLNSHFMLDNVNFVDPNKIGINPSDYGFDLYFSRVPTKILNSIMDKLYKLNIKRIKFLTKNVLLFYSDSTSEENIDYFTAFYQNLHG